MLLLLCNLSKFFAFILISFVLNFALEIFVLNLVSAFARNMLSPTHSLTFPSLSLFSSPPPLYLSRTPIHHICHSLAPCMAIYIPLYDSIVLGHMGITTTMIKLAVNTKCRTKNAGKRIEKQTFYAKKKSFIILFIALLCLVVGIKWSACTN